MSSSAVTDARLIRAQSRAHSDGDLAAAGQEITRYLLNVKLSGQADNLSKFFAADDIANLIREYAASEPIPEGKAAEAYWATWSNRVAVPWSPTDCLKVPATWLGFAQRPSLNGAQPPNKDATDPVNAVLNYLYRVAETECVHACYAYGLHPALGISHTDKSGRDSMALDLLEVIRPLCDRIALEILAPDGAIPYVNWKPAYFDRRWFHETREGTCRIMPPLTHRLASHAAGLAAAIESPAYHVARMLAQAGEGIISVKRPVKPAKPTGVHRGTPMIRLRPGVTVSQIVPDVLWNKLEPLLPARPSKVRGRNTAPVSREVVASIAVRYMLRCGWKDCPLTDRQTVNRWLAHWRTSGAWSRAEMILSESGHLAALVA
jgi:transposase